MNPLPRTPLRLVHAENAAPVSAPIGRSMRHALVCLDLAPASEICLAYAQMVAAAFGTEITLTHVMPSAKPGSGAWSRTDVLEWEIERREAQQYLEQASALLGERVTPSVHTALTQGTPAERITATATEVGADLTIVASDSAFVPRAGRVGGIAQRVLAMSTGSVLLAHGSASIPPRRIVVPLDGSPRTELVLPSVLSLAHTFGAEVILVHIVSERAPSAVLSEPGDVEIAQQLATRMERSAEQYLTRIRTRELRSVPSVKLIVRARPDERRAILDIASQSHADLLVLAAHGSTCDLDSAFGSVASYLLARSSVPMLVVQDAPTAQRDTPVPSYAPRRPSGIRLREDA